MDKWINSIEDWPEDDNSYYWVSINGFSVKLYYLVRYPSLDYWQDLRGDEYEIEDTKYIKISRPKPPSGKD